MGRFHRPVSDHRDKYIGKTYGMYLYSSNCILKNIVLIQATDQVERPSWKHETNKLWSQEHEFIQIIDSVVYLNYYFYITEFTKL